MDRQNKRLSVLLVEDNESDYILLREQMTDRPVDLIWTTRLAQGINLAKEKNFDAVLLDLALPDGVGLNTFESMHSACADIPIIVLCGLDNDLVALAAMQKGAQDYLVKGKISEDLLERSLHYAIARFEAERLARQARDEVFHAAPFAASRLGQDLTILSVNRYFLTELVADKSSPIGCKLNDVLPGIPHDQVAKAVAVGSSFSASGLNIHPGHHAEVLWDLLVWPLMARQGTTSGAIFTARQQPIK